MASDKIPESDNDKNQEEINSTIVKSKILYITKRTVRFGSDVYQFHNVTGFGVSEIKTKNVIPLVLILVLAIIGIISRAYDILKLEVITALMAFLAFYTNRIIPKQYGLKLYLNSGYVKVFTTKNKKFLDEVIYTLYQFMESDKEGTYIVNIEDKSIKVGGSVGGSITAGDVEGNLISYVGRNVLGKVSQE